MPVPRLIQLGSYQPGSLGSWQRPANLKLFLEALGGGQEAWRSGTCDVM